MSEFTIRHHYKTTEEEFLKKQAEILAEILVKAIEEGEISL